VTEPLENGAPRSGVERFIAALVRRPVGVLMLTLALLGAAWIAASRIPVELLPPGFASSSISVTVPWAGANPPEVERRILRPLEDELRGLGGVKEMFANAGPGSGTVVMVFAGDFDMDMAHAEVSDRVERVRGRLPKEADRITVRRWTSTDMPIAWCGVVYPPGEWDEAQDILGEKLQERLEALDGVARAQVHGVAPLSIRIFLDQDQVRANRVDIGSLVARLQADNLSSPVGDLDQAGSRFLVRVDSRFTSIEEIENYPVSQGIRIRDIGRVEAVRSAPNSLFRIGGQYGLAVAISKEASANTFETCALIKKAFEEDFPADPFLGNYKFTIWWTEAESIEDSLTSLVEDAALGGLIACLVLFLFLRRMRFTLLVAGSIPFSVLLTLAWLYFTGRSFNTLAMVGITISVGMLVDNSVVVVESIFALREKGKSLLESCVKGPGEVVLAVVTATLTTVVVFLPLIFMAKDRNTKTIASAIGWPLCIALLAALFLAIVLVPVASRYLGGSTRIRSRGKDGKGGIFAFAPRLVDWSLKRRFRALTLAGLFLASGSLASEGSGKSSSMELYGGETRIHMTFGENTTLREAETRVIEMEEVLAREGIFSDWGEVTTGIEFSRKRGTLNMWFDKSPNPEEREALFAMLKENLPPLAGVQYRFGRQFDTRSTSEDRWTRILIEGPETLGVATLAEEIRARAREMEEFKEVHRPDQMEREVRVVLDRERMSRMGTGSSGILRNIEWALRGFMVSRFQSKGREIPIIVEYDLPPIPDRSRLEQMEVWTGQALVPLASLASFQAGRAPANISRRNGRTVDMVGVKPVSRDIAKTRIALEALMGGIDWPEGYSWKQQGGWQGFQDDQTEIFAAFSLSVALVFLLMGLLFDSLVLPLSVLATIPFSMVGARWAMKITNTPLDLLGMVGMIVLAGVVVNNGIVLVDRIRRLERAGVDRREAVVGAVRDRIRPVAMTALTTIAGLLPIALSSPDGRGLSFQSLAVVVAGGLAFSTFFTLWVVPLLYTLLQDFGEIAGRRFKPALFTARPRA
jgi:HAE1 family hydrophobic/amphiphilic exporter-1